MEISKPENNSEMLGASYSADGYCSFRVWAPMAEAVEVLFPDKDNLSLPMVRDSEGYWSIRVENVAAGTDYLYRLDRNISYPDPASHWQPDGVFGASRIIDHDNYCWQDQLWAGIPLGNYIIYELHVGCFTPEGTFRAIIQRLPYLVDLGVTAIELMPVSQFSGNYNWGYDGVFPFAVHYQYGAPDHLKQLVDACHQAGLAVILDVVYNHLGPEGNVLPAFGPYCTERYRTPWGDALNFDGPYSDQVRCFFLENALYWLSRYHIDALRLDAIHSIYDFSAKPFLQQLAEKISEFSQSSKQTQRYLIAESDLNDTRTIRSSDTGGYGLSAQWNDDFHHALHALLTNEKTGYYCDFGDIADLTQAYREGFVYNWRYSPYRQRHHGSSSAELAGYRFVVYAQSHDQVGNRGRGERLISLISFEAAKLAAAAVMFAPYLPLLFMGEEYGEENPFLFFTDFADQQLQEAIRQERIAKIRGWQDHEELNLLACFKTSKLSWDMTLGSGKQILFNLYRELIQLRRTVPALADPDKDNLEVTSEPQRKVIMLYRFQEDSRVIVFLNFNRNQVQMMFPSRAGVWEKAFDSASSVWLGAGSETPERMNAGDPLSIAPLSATLYLSTYDE